VGRGRAILRAQRSRPGLLNMNRADKKSLDPREVELKLQLLPGSRTVLEASNVFAAAKATQLHQVTTYFDTPKGILYKAGLTLRVRRSGNSRLQTVKSRANGRGLAMSRSEWEWLIGQNDPDVERLAETPELAKVVKQIKGRLEPMFITDIRRTVRLLHLDGSSVVEAAIDVGRIRAGLASEPVSELELELKDGDIGPMYRLAAHLQKLAPLWISTESKAARGWQLRTGQTEGAQEAQWPKLGRNIPAADGFQKIIGGTLRHLIANVGPTLRGDPEGVHQMRVALRGCRAALNLFQPHLNAKTTRRFDEALQRFGRIFGAARDWDVFCLNTLPVAMKDLPAQRLRDLNQVAEIQRQAAHAAVVEALCGRHFTALVLGLAVWTETGAERPCTLGDDRMRKRLATLAPSLLDRVECKATKRARHVGRLSVEKLHRLRKSLDKLCDDVKYLAGLFPLRAVNKYRDRCENVQEVLGLANDAVVTKQLALKLVTGNRPGLLKPSRTLVLWNERRRQKTMQGLKGALKHFHETPLFWS
jgi:triphosphatase